ncbi:phosphoribosylformylglycinamidine cyclo-ligase [Candidatus Curtissbacteria bacterium]|nr:phosphoribosylformylglycinamidine cyclo-ligase [Candidatus Curtissbacteria bacterium]
MKKITYAQVGDNYMTKDPTKVLAQKSAKLTAKNLKKQGFYEIADTRGESAYVWGQGTMLMASVIEGLGTKNLIADKMYQLTGRSYYDVIGHDTVATGLNDLISVGATPLVVHAYWAIENNDWLQDMKRMNDLVSGWTSACNLAGASWGGGETATQTDINNKNAVDLGVSAIGFIKKDKNLVLGSNIEVGDRIIFLKSNGVNANGITLTRKIADRLKNGYLEMIEPGLTYGDALLTRTNIYAQLIQNLQKSNINIHYLSNITGHGLRKVMRSKKEVTYVIEKVFEPQEIFKFIQKQAGLSDYESFDTYNMGQDYAIFISEKDVKKVQEIIKSSGFESIVAGFVEKGSRRVVIKPKNIVFESKSLSLI